METRCLQNPSHFRFARQIDIRILVTQSDRARSALWHTRNRAYREWVEANRELLDYYRGRKVWLMQPDSSLQPQPYPGR